MLHVTLDDIKSMINDGNNTQEIKNREENPHSIASDTDTMPNSSGNSNKYLLPSPRSKHQYFNMSKRYLPRGSCDHSPMDVIDTCLSNERTDNGNFPNSLKTVSAMEKTNAYLLSQTNALVGNFRPKIRDHSEDDLLDNYYPSEIRMKPISRQLPQRRFSLFSSSDPNSYKDFDDCQYPFSHCGVPIYRRRFSDSQEYPPQHGYCNRGCLDHSDYNSSQTINNPTTCNAHCQQFNNPLSHQPQKCGFSAQPYPMPSSVVDIQASIPDIPTYFNHVVQNVPTIGVQRSLQHVPQTSLNIPSMIGEVSSVVTEAANTGTECSIEFKEEMDTYACTENKGLYGSQEVRGCYD